MPDAETTPTATQPSTAQPVSTGLRKRQQISNANRIMFIWIAAVSAVVGVALVASIFLIQKIVFGEKILGAKRDTATVLKKNYDSVATLKNNLSVVNTNENLASVRLNENDPPLQSVLDALPASSNATALGSSLQKKLLAGVPGLAIEAITVEPVTDTGAGSDNSSPSSIKYSFSVSVATAAYSSLQDLFKKVEKSIRPFNITNLSIEAQAAKVTMTADGVSYYQPAQSLELRDKVVKP